MDRRPRRPPPKTSSERGRKFRASQRSRERALEGETAIARQQVQALERSRQLYWERFLRERYAQDGSYQRSIRELFTLFCDGLEDASASPHLVEQVCMKENYLRYIYDPDTISGDLRGVDAVIDQWRRYTVFHDRFHLDMRHIEVLGDPENPVFHLHVQLTVRISRKTFETMFPNALHLENIVQNFLNKQIQYNCIVQFRFGEDGKIIDYSVNVDFIDGLVRAGGSLDEVAAMLQQTTI